MVPKILKRKLDWKIDALQTTPSDSDPQLIGSPTDPPDGRPDRRDAELGGWPRKLSRHRRRIVHESTLQRLAAL